jgi:A/G-specific adenine glycosylase
LLLPKGVCSFGFRDAKDNPATFNQAIMEFGALQYPKSPNCGVCVFNDSCAALQKKVDQLPVKSKKLKVRNRYFNYLVVSDENENTLIQKRTAKGIWQNLYEFPLIETAKEEEFDFVAEQIKTDYFSDNELLSVMACNVSSINYHTTFIY